MKKVLAALALCTAVATPAQATIIDHGDYLTDTATGLDWLDVTKSVNMSYNYVSTQFGAGGLFEGWRYATADQFNGLIGSYTGTRPTTYEVVNQEQDKIDGLVTLLGSTYSRNCFLFCLPIGGQSTSVSPEDVQYRITIGWLEVLSSFFIWTLHTPETAALVDDDFMVTSGSIGTDYSTVNFDVQNIRYTYESRNDQGSYLVRNTSFVGATSSVPEPSTAALLGLSLLGFAANRRKSKAE